MNIYKKSELSVYYAHPMSWYGTDEERVDLAYLQRTYASIINPGTAESEDTYQKWKLMNPEQPAMEFWLRLVDRADAIVFRTFKDGKLGAGVAAEVFHAKITGKFIDRLIGNDRWGTAVHAIPQDSLSSFNQLLTIEQTKARVRQGQL